MLHLVLRLAVCLSGRLVLSLRTQPSQETAQARYGAGSAARAPVARGSAPSAAAGASRGKLGDAGASAGRAGQPWQLSTPLAAADGASGPAALGRVLRAGSSGIGYLDGLLRGAREAHARAFARLWNLLNVTSSGVERLDGVARGMKESYATREVVNSTHNESAAALWASYQGELASAVESSYPRSARTLRVLVVSPVAGDEPAVEGFARNAERLRGNRAGDVFDFALFHYDGNTTLWQRLPWYSGEGSPVVLRVSGPLCKGHAWASVTPALAAAYDYLWLMDGDLELDYFSWDLYRGVLLALDPLVSQPAVLARDSGGRSSDIGQLRMVGLERGVFPLAREVGRSEGMAAVLSARLWPAVHARLRGSDPRTIWYATDFWDAAALAAARACGGAGIVLVNASPVRHLNRHDLLANGSVGESHNCTKGCGAGDANCRPVGPAEWRLLGEGLRGRCDLPGSAGPGCEGPVRDCQLALAAGLERREWAARLGGVAALRYRCNVSGALAPNAEPCSVAAVWPAPA